SGGTRRRLRGDRARLHAQARGKGRRHGARDLALLPRARAGASAGGAPFGNAAGRGSAGALDAGDGEGSSSLAGRVQGPVQRRIFEAVRARGSAEAAEDGRDRAAHRGAVRAAEGGGRREDRRPAGRRAVGGHEELALRRVARRPGHLGADAGGGGGHGFEAGRRRTLEGDRARVLAPGGGQGGAGGAGRRADGGVRAHRREGAVRRSHGLQARQVRPALAVLLCAGCAQALHKPPPIEEVAPPPRAGADQLLTDADDAWGRRAEPGQAATAADLYLQAARADPRRAEAFGGAIRAKAFRIGREKDGAARTRLAESAVIAGQLCEENAPGAAACDYWLAAALGLQARERSATGKDAL